MKIRYYQLNYENESRYNFSNFAYKFEIIGHIKLEDFQALSKISSFYESTQIAKNVARIRGYIRYGYAAKFTELCFKIGKK